MNEIRSKIFIVVLCTSFLLLSSNLVVAQSNDVLTWHSSVTTGAIFGWQVTYTEADEPGISFPLADKTVTDGDVIQLRFVSNPPTDAEELFELDAPPSWVYMYVNGYQADYNQMGDEGIAFLMLILPVGVDLENGTSFDLTDIQQIGAPYDDMVSYYHFNSTHVNATFIDQYVRLNYIINLETGISGYLSADVYDMGFSMVLEYFNEAANVDEGGETESINPNYNVFTGVSSGFEMYLLVGGAGAAAVAVIVVVLVIRRRG